ncbi:helix-turn-helix domain-containing protein [Phytohabitans kaempferiae]|uniref:Helix-turn-helix domain-containing protein n=1 Tax=Phytohabitans kaempferiae TaxID=1620943 RepID=A0ABV6LY98_9ACTN
MAMFGGMLRELRTQRGLSLSQLGRMVHYNKGYLSRVESGQRQPSEDLARRCDDALQARGDLIAAAHIDIAAARDTKPSATTELLRRIQASDITEGSLSALHATVHELCCQYSYRDAMELRTEAHDWLREVARVLRQPVGLHQHRELLTAAGWLALLVGCLEYDLGMRAGAEATRTAAAQLGAEAGATEIVGWSFEMSAWFALTQGRYPAVVDAVEGGQAADRGHSVLVQLAAQEAKSRARMGDVPGMRAALERGRTILDRLPVPARVDNHFVVDPAKWDFYAMDASRLAGDNENAGRYAAEVIAGGTTPDGTARWPMRLAEARLTLAVVAARAGELEQAVNYGIQALDVPRRSLPSLMMVAGELDVELQRRYPDEAATEAFREALRAIR